MSRPAKQTSHSLRYREVACQAWSQVIQPYLQNHLPALTETAFYAVGSSVAYGLADEHSDIDTVLILPADDHAACEKELVEWAYHSSDLAAFNRRMHTELNIKVSIWQREGVGVLFDGKGSWDDFYNGHQHWVMTLIPIHDPLGQMKVIQDSLTRLPEGLAERAAEQYAGQLADLRCVLQKLSVPGQERFVGLLSYSITSRALHSLFHRERVPLPFHKWQWKFAERLSNESGVVLRQLREMLERQMGVISFPEGLIGSEVRRAPSHVPPLPMGVSLPPEMVERALASVQWHLEERGCYQMVRARARGWHEASLQYMCAARCLLIKGMILLEANTIACGEDVSTMWKQVSERIPGLEDCLWPRANEDPFEQTLRGIALFRQRLRDKQALPQTYLDRPLCSPPSYDLACILEEL
ncbi:MAG TPA: hypothetical protein VFI02_21850 [Armatimonadota bacterium]|nr:hypothetical protein [Armatimonadota bacterium]